MVTYSPQDYFEVAVERHAQAKWMFAVKAEDCDELDEKRYSLVIYVAGVAVESLFRAYRGLFDSTFDEGHAIAPLFAASKMRDVLQKWLKQQGVSGDSLFDRLAGLNASVEELARVWHNNHRYTCERMLVQILRQRRVIKNRDNRGGKADVLRRQAEKVLKNVTEILTVGSEAWPN